MDLWEVALWEQIRSRAPIDQVTYTGELITYIQQKLVPAIARHRRMTVVVLKDEKGMSNGLLADTIGARAGTIARLAEEGRRTIRQEVTSG